MLRDMVWLKAKKMVRKTHPTGASKFIWCIKQGKKCVLDEKHYAYCAHFYPGRATTLVTPFILESDAGD